MKKCTICGVCVSNLRKHVARNRCSKQHIRKGEDKRLKQLRRDKIAKEKVFYKDTT